MSSSNSETNPSVDFVRGMVFWEARPEVRKRAAERIAKRRSTRGDSFDVATFALHQRVLKVADDTLEAICVEEPWTLNESIDRCTASDLVASHAWLPVDREPLQLLRMSDQDLTEKQIQHRSKNVDLLRPLIDLDLDVLIPSVRGPVIRRICERRGLDEPTVYRPLSLFLKGGLHLNSLAGNWPRRHRCVRFGARKGHIRLARPGSTRGRPRLDQRPTFTVTEVDIPRLIEGGSRFFFAEGSRNTWRRAWLLTIGTFYLGLGDAAAVRPNLLRDTPPNHYPSLRQFKYYACFDQDYTKQLKRRVGQRAFDLNHRPHHSRTAIRIAGPGSQYFIDPTPFDVVLVHRVTRRPIGKFKLYLVVDLFSHLITGYYLHFGSAGYDAASMAMLACAEDKVALCARYGLDIARDQWPCNWLPDTLIADSELSSFRAHALVKKGVCNLTIVAAYRAELKGLIEALIGSITRASKHLPGYCPSTRQRCTTDPEIHAALDYIELNRVIIHWILKSNRRVLKDYPFTDAMRVDQVRPVPLELWCWGVANAAGFRRTWTMDCVMANCLPTATARMTRRGLQFADLYYRPTENSIPEFEAMQVRAATREWTEEVTYHPAAARTLWLHRGDERIAMELSEESSGRADWTVFDVEAEVENSRAVDRDEETKNIPCEAATECAIENIVQKAKRQTEAVLGKPSKRRKSGPEKLDDRKSEADAIRGVPNRPASVDPTAGIPRDLAKRDQAAAIAAIRRARASRSHQEGET